MVEKTKNVLAVVINGKAKENDIDIWSWSQLSSHVGRSAIDTIKIVNDLAGNPMHEKGSTRKYCPLITLNVQIHSTRPIGS